MTVQLYLFTLSDPACRKIHSLHMASCYVGFGPCIWVIVKVLHLQRCKGSPGNLEPCLLSLSSRPSLVITGPDGQSQTLIWLMGEINRMFSVIVLQREIQLLEYGKILIEY